MVTAIAPASTSTKTSTERIISHHSYYISIISIHVTDVVRVVTVIDVAEMVQTTRRANVLTTRRANVLISLNYLMKQFKSKSDHDYGHAYLPKVDKTGGRGGPWYNFKRISLRVNIKYRILQRKASIFKRRTPIELFSLFHQTSSSLGCNFKSSS